VPRGLPAERHRVVEHKAAAGNPLQQRRSDLPERSHTFGRQCRYQSAAKSSSAHGVARTGIAGPMSLRVVVADDESLVRKSILRFLRDHDVEILEECEDGASALEAIRL